MNELSITLKHDDELCDTAEVWIKAVVDGTELDFILDTGCATTSLCYNDFSRNYASLERSEYSSAFGKAKSDKIQISSKKTGPISVADVKIARTAEGGNDKNLFGMDLLKAWDFEIALSERRLSFQPAVEKSLKTHSLILDEGSIPFIEVHSGVVTAKAVWDTGAGITIVDRDFFNTNKHLFKSLGSTKGTDSTGTSFDTEIFLMEPIKIGEYLFPEHRVVPLDLSHLGPKTGRGMDFILGYSTLRHAHWIMDFKNKTWSISKALF